MKNVIKYFVLAALLFSGLAPVSAGQSKAAPRNQNAVVAAARAIAEAYYQPGWFSGSVLLARDGLPIYQASFGMSDRKAAAPNHQNTKYNLGSIMKHYTAVLVLQQVEKGALDLEDRLDAFQLGFPSIPASKISIHHLLHHRSGFADIFTAEYREDQLAFDTIAKRLELLKDAPLLFEPGSEFRYSNFGYVVLGAILEKVTGKSFAELLHKNIFDRLGTKDSVYPYQANAENQSLRYTFNYAGEQVLVGVTEHHGPDGGIEATVADVLTFYRALFYSDKLLSRQEDASREYFRFEGKHWGAFGGGAGVSSAAELDLENNYQIIVLANSDQLVAEEISGRIYSYIKSGSYDPIKLPPHVYAWAKYQELGAEVFKSDFAARYKSDGYTQFIGRTLNELGMSLLKADKWNQALDVFQTLAELFPKAPQAYDSLAYAYVSKGDAKKGAQVFRRALALQADFSSEYSSDNYGATAL